MTHYGSVWSREYIDSEPIPVVSKSLLPWLKKDRREAEEGAMVKATNKDGKMEIAHNGEGLERAERDLRRIKGDLAAETPGSDRSIILARQAEGMAERVEAWQGKIYLLDKVIAATQGRVE